MGWLFAVALGHAGRRPRARSCGRCRRSRSATRLSIALVVALVLGLGVLADPSALHIGAGVALIAFGVFRFAKPRAHPRWIKVRVNRPRARAGGRS